MSEPELWDRNELYELAWQQPLVKLAVVYGVSGVYLAKVCRKLQVPVPGRGYWARKAYGHAGPRPPLPPLDQVPAIRKPQPKPKLEPVQAGPVEPKMEGILRLEQSANIPPAPPKRNHPLIQHARQFLRQAHVDDRKILRAWKSESCLDVRVSKKSLRRALDITATLFSILETEGLTVTVDPKQRDSTSVRIFGQDVQFGLLERVKMVRIEPPAPDTRSRSYSSRTVKYVQTGELYLQLLDYVWDEPLRKTWSDGKHRRLEDMLPQCVAGMMRMALTLRRRAERRAQEALAQKKRDEELARLRQEVEAEEQRVSELDEDVSGWRRAQEIRAYIAALVEAARRQGKDEESSELTEWVGWANAQADRLDPLVESPPSVLDKKPEVAGPRW